MAMFQRIPSNQMNAIIRLKETGFARCLSLSACKMVINFLDLYFVSRYVTEVVKNLYFSLQILIDLNF